jgi:hypothetical protein
VSDLDLAPIRERAGRAASLRASGTFDPPQAKTVYAQSAADVPVLLAEIERLRAEVFTLANSEDAMLAIVTVERDALRKELAEEKQSHEQTVENFADWIEDHQARSFRITPPTHTVGWVWNCLACPANGSFAREADAFGWASAHEMRTHGGGRVAAEAARAEQ